MFLVYYVALLLLGLSPSMRITRKVDTSAVKADPGVVAPNTAMENMVV